MSLDHMPQANLNVPYRIYIGLGANIGTPFSALKRAIQELKQEKSVTIEFISSLWETSPVGFSDQPAFLNVVMVVATCLPIQAFYGITARIERHLGKHKVFVNGPRVIDIDILSAEGVLCMSDSLIIPHPRVWDRLFVLLPLKEALEYLHVHSIAIRIHEDAVTKGAICDRICALQKIGDQKATLCKDYTSHWWE